MLRTTADWNTAREAAARLCVDGPPELGWILWLDARLAALGHPPITRWWRETLDAFWRSKRTFFALEKGQRATASSTLARALMVESFFRDRTLVLEQVGICSVVSVDVRGADSAVSRTITAILNVFGIEDVYHKDKATMGRVASGSHEWQTRDSFDRALTFQLRPPSRSASVAGTFVGYLADEVNLWAKDESLKEPAAAVIELLMGRLHGQIGAHGYHTSTPEGTDGALTTIIEASAAAGSEQLYIARLGEYGAQRDGEARESFRMHLQNLALHSESPQLRASCERWEADPRITADPDPQSTHVPTWSARDGDPLAEILECWRLVGVALRKGSEGGDQLDVLMHRYGAQPGGDAGRRLFADDLLDSAFGRQWQ